MSFTPLSHRIHRTVGAVGVVALAAALVVPLAPAASAQTVAQTTIVSADPANFTPNVLDGKVNAIAQVGSTIVLGGSFTQVQASTGGATLTRSNMVAFNATTGVISTTFAPTVAGEVYDVEPAADGTSVYAVGSFTQVNGTTTSRVARLSVATGAKVAGFASPTINGTVKNVDLVGSRLLLGGSFSTVGGVTRTRLASLDPSTGALTSFLNLSVTGANAGGGTQVLKMAVSPNGSRLVAIGNFTAVAGQERLQIAMVDLSGATATLSSWATGFYTNSCNPVFNTYMRDLDFAPDSSYFVVSTTGAYGGDQSPCDVITRWETSATGPDQVATWRDYTGGDTTYAVAVTGSAVYVGGHMRWMNNPYAGDAAGPGAVPREGIAALDPTTGLPLSWNPGRDRGVGVFDLLATSTGLWVGSDTNLIGGETHRKIAFFPLAGGATLPAQVLGTVPNDVYLLGRTGSSADPGVLYRVNAGGPPIQSADDGPDWLSDDQAAGYKSGASNAAGWGVVPTLDSSVPQATNDRAPASLFSSESWGPDSGNEMAWHFPVTAGANVTVRLYLSNRCDCTNVVGARVFNISIDGDVVAPELDLVAAYGDQVGAMQSYPITSDGSVDIDFGHVTENPLINGIEIITTGSQSGGGGGGISAADDVQRRYFTGTSATGNTVLTPTANWSLSRGTFLVDGNLYAAFADGTLTRRSFNGTTFGAPTTIPLYGSTFGGDIPNLTGIVYSKGRVYYTLFGSSDLHWRWFSPQSSVVGATDFLADGNVGELDPGDVQGMFLSGSTLYAAQRSSGHLIRVGLSGTSVTGSAVTVDTVNDWRARSVFLWNGTPAPAPNVNPVAVATGDCPPAGGYTCTFDGSGSSDSDGSIASYAWTFSGGGTATGATPSHTFATAGQQTATLTVTDNRGGTATKTVTVTVVATADAPPTAVIAVPVCNGLACSFNGSGSSDAEGAITYAWDFGDGASSTQPNPSHTYASANTYTVTLTVEDTANQTDTDTRSVTVAPVTSSITSHGAASVAANATSLTIPAPTAMAQSDALLLFVTNNTGGSPTGVPAGWTLVGERLDGTDVRTLVYQRVAPAGTALGSVAWGATTKATATVLAYSGAVAVPTAFASADQAATVSSFSTPGAAVSTAGSRVVSYWALKASAAPVWTAAAGATAVLGGSATNTGSGLVSSFTADEVASSNAPARSATSSVASGKATTWTVVLRPV